MKITSPEAMETVNFPKKSESNLECKGTVYI